MSQTAYIHTYTDSYGVTQLYLSGSATGKGFIHKTIFEAAVASIKTNIIASKRRYYPATKIWAIDNDYWQIQRNAFLALPSVFTLISHTSLDDFDAVVSGASAKVKGDKWAGPDNQAAADFFHSFNTSIARIADDSHDKKLLAELLRVGSFDAIPTDKAVAKKLYRAAALIHHPDKNAGNGHKMSELNRLWGAYVEPTLR